MFFDRIRIRIVIIKIRLKTAKGELRSTVGCFDLDSSTSRFVCCTRGEPSMELWINCSAIYYNVYTVMRLKWHQFKKENQEVNIIGRLLNQEE